MCYIRRYTIRLTIVSILFLLNQVDLYGFQQNEDDLPRIKGKVVDESTREPLAGVQVYLPDLSKGAVTKNDGTYELKLPRKGQYTVIFRMIGYQEVRLKLAVDKETTRNISLTVVPIDVGEVVVEGKPNALTESSQSLTILSTEELQKTRGQTFGETLEDVPGVTTLQTGPSISKPVVRGLHSQRLLILNSGVPQEGQQWGGEHAPEIDPFAPDRIEIIKGAAGVQYGPSAIGGVIRVEPREIRTNPGFGAQFSMNAFSNNRQGSGSLLLEGSSSRFRNVGWRVRGSVRKAGDSRAPYYVINNSGFEEGDWSFALGYNRPNRGVELNYSFFGTELGIFRGSHIGNLSDLNRAIENGSPIVEKDFTYDILAPKQNVRHKLLSIRGKYKLTSLGLFEFQYGWQRNHRQEFDAHQRFTSEPPKKAAFDLSLTTYTLDLKLKHRPIKSLYGTIGFSGMHQGNIRKSTGFLIPDFEANTAGVYAIENWSRGKWNFNSGMRFDYRKLKVLPVGNDIDELTDSHCLAEVTHPFPISRSRSDLFPVSLAQIVIRRMFDIGLRAGDPFLFVLQFLLDYIQIDAP